MSTISQVCSWCGISETTFHDAVKRGVIAKKLRGQYDVQKVAQVLIKDGQAAKGGHGDYASKVGLSEARAELAREQTTAVALKNSIARGEYVSLAGVKRGVEILFSAFRERILAIPGKVAASCEMRSRGVIEEIVRDELYEALEELSRPILPVAETGTGEADETEVAADDADEVIP